jgi:hypothetical protein
MQTYVGVEVQQGAGVVQFMMFVNALVALILPLNDPLYNIFTCVSDCRRDLDILNYYGT